MFPRLKHNMYREILQAVVAKSPTLASTSLFVQSKMYMLCSPSRGNKSI